VLAQTAIGLLDRASISEARKWDVLQIVCQSQSSKFAAVDTGQCSYRSCRDVTQHWGHVEGFHLLELLEMDELPQCTLGEVGGANRSREDEKIYI
jgi:hypothetical protein